MANIEYDLDVSGGLMPQIQALIAPPTSDEASRRGRKLKKNRGNQSASSQQPNCDGRNNQLVRPTKAGKMPNHEYCDSCKEGGDLLCCDRCPAAFHFQCHEPPLDEEEVPSGEWICRRCKVIEEMDEEAGDSDEAVVNNLEIGHEHSRTENESVEYQHTNGECLDDESEANKVKKPLMMLVKAAKMMNPKQFQLPNELTPSIQLVGTSKKQNTNRQTKRPFHELDNGLVPFPIRTCFKCSLSCRKSPLIQCDYCPLLYHCDCLDPPLTVLPTTKWMCPNHPEHVLEQKLLDSVSLTKRIKLWDRFSGRFSQDAVKIDFLKNVHRKNPPYRYKVLTPVGNRVVVPNAVKEMYKNRPKLLPDQNNHDFICNFKQENQVNNEINFKNKPTIEEQEQWLSDLIAFQSSVACHLAAKQINERKIKPDENELPVNSSNLIKANLSQAQTEKNKISNHLTSNGSFVNNNHNECDEFLDNVKKPFENDNVQQAKVKFEKLESETKSSVKPQSSVQQNDKPKQSPALISFNNSFHSYIDDINDIELNKLDENLLRVLAWQRLQQLVNNNSKAHLDCRNANSPNINTMPSQTTVKRICLGDVKARAVLCPVFIRSGNNPPNTNGPAIAMSYRTLTVGIGADNDVVLSNYGFCNFVSSRHACIFYDEASRQYELINYSEHGTTVDNVLYSCDFSDKKVSNAKYINETSAVSVVKNLVKRGRKRKEEFHTKKRKNLLNNQNGCEEEEKEVKSDKKKSCKYNAQEKPKNLVKKETNEIGNEEKITVQVQAHNLMTMSSRSGQTWRSCACKSSCSTLIGGNGAGWEGTAVLHHGSYIKIGCHQFVFSITNYGTPQVVAANQSTIKTVTVRSPSIGDQSTK